MRIKSMTKLLCNSLELQSMNKQKDAVKVIKEMETKTNQNNDVLRYSQFTLGLIKLT